MTSVLFEVDGRGVATLVLNRPERHNSFDQASLDEFMGHLERCREPEVRIVCIRARGKHFCAGADVRDLLDAPDPNQRPGGASLPGMLRRLNMLPLPTVALVQGACIGGGVALAACCDVVIAEEGAFLSISEVRLGIPPAALIPYLAIAIGARRLRRYALSAERIDARKCLETGLVHEVCPQGKLDEAAAPIIDSLLRGSPRAIEATKIAISDAAPVPLSLEQEVDLLRQVRLIAASPEAKEGIAAFLEKRDPRWYRST